MGGDREGQGTGRELRCLRPRRFRRAALSRQIQNLNGQSRSYGIWQDRRGHSERYRPADLAREGLGGGDADGMGGIEPVRFGEFRGAVEHRSIGRYDAHGLPVALEVALGLLGRLGSHQPEPYGPLKRRAHLDYVLSTAKTAVAFLTARHGVPEPGSAT